MNIQSVVFWLMVVATVLNLFMAYRGYLELRRLETLCKTLESHNDFILKGLELQRDLKD